MPWVDVVLASDDDLRDQESRMPEQAMAIQGRGGRAAYDGKRRIAKRDIESWLRRRGLDPDGLNQPTQLNVAAVYKELALIYRDMANRNDTVAMEKAEYYESQYDEELDGLALDYTAPTETPAVEWKFNIPLRRG